jgi:hypothetical protein
MADFNRRSPSNELRARLDLPERAPQSLIALMDRFNAPTAATTEAALFAAVERGIAELVHVAGRNPDGADDLHVHGSRPPNPARTVRTSN